MLIYWLLDDSSNDKSGSQGSNSDPEEVKRQVNYHTKFLIFLFEEKSILKFVLGAVEKTTRNAGEISTGIFFKPFDL